LKFNLKKTIGLMSLLIACSWVAGQNQQYPIVSAQFRNQKLWDVFNTLEGKTGYRFFYDISKLDTSDINISFQAQPLNHVLQTLTNGKNIYFSLVGRKNVFITQGQVLLEQLPDWFYSNNPPVKTIAIEPAQNNVAREFKTTTQPLLLIGKKEEGTGSVIISGYVREIKNGEPIAGASLQIENTGIGTVTDRYGFFTLLVPKGKNILSVQSIGMEDERLDLLVQGAGNMQVNMQTRIMSLKNVVISAQKMNNIRTAQLGVQKLDIKTIKQVPVVFGEADIMRVLLTTPGVKTVGEASTGLNVRGGAADQNLILFNEANVYNPSHFFGMFSAFNPEVIKDVELFKGSIPARYGGRLSSVVNINSREGNKKKFAGSAGIGLLTSRLQIEGPIVKDKSSFILAGRTTYTDWLLKQLPAEYKNSKASFYDVNAVVNHEFNEKSSINFTAYMSRDRFNLNTDTFFHYKNQNIALKWKYNFNPRFNTGFSVGYDRYEYNITSDKNPINAYELRFDIAQAYLRNHYSYMINNKHTLEFGLNATYHKLHSGNYYPLGSQSLVEPVAMPAEQAAETALYISDIYKITQNLTIDGGFRYVLYSYLGPGTVNQYPAGVPLREDNITGTVLYTANKIINTYQGPEIRVGLRQMLSNTFSVKAGYNSLRQYIHMLSNTAAMAPTDIWKLSDPNIKPQFGDQFSLGLYKNLKSNTIEISLEGYYKRIKDYLDFKSGAVLVLNTHIETDVLPTKGKAYGVEFLIKKSTGKLNGWLSYTYSRILLKADDPSAGEIINKGNWYPANYDKPHDVTLIGNYRISHRFSISLNSTYSTGRPITLPIGRFYYDGGMRTLYDDRNAHRIPDYFRTDFSMNIDGNHKINQKFHNSWTIGVYNLTGRRNPYSVYYVSQNGVINGYKLSIFGSAIPFINFNIRF
jgi:hypothetical protein